MQAGGKSRTVKTDDSGRAEFRNLPAGETSSSWQWSTASVWSRESFPAPTQGGIRLMLVATDKSKKPQTEPACSAVSGLVVLGNQSRIVLEPGDEVVAVYYLLDIVNNARVPVNPPAAVLLSTCRHGCVGTSLLRGSSPQASVDGPHVVVQSPFAPGRTLVQVACELSVASASLQLTQRFPAALEQLAVVVKKLDDTKLVSAQVSSQQEMTASGEAFIAGTGGAVAAGQSINLSLTNLPHHSAVPRWTTLTLASLIILGGVWLSNRGPDGDSRAAERKRLITRRDKLFTELVRLGTRSKNESRQSGSIRGSTPGAGSSAGKHLRLPGQRRHGPWPRSLWSRRVTIDFDQVRLVDVSRHFGRRRAVARVTLSARSGEIVGLLGPNGAGKSTLIGMMATLVTPAPVRFAMETPSRDGLAGPCGHASGCSRTSCTSIQSCRRGRTSDSSPSCTASTSGTRLTRALDGAGSDRSSRRRRLVVLARDAPASGTGASAPASAATGSSRRAIHRARRSRGENRVRTPQTTGRRWRDRHPRHPRSRYCRRPGDANRDRA